MDGSNSLRIGTGFAGTAVEDIRSVCLCVLEGDATKLGLRSSGCNCSSEASCSTSPAGAPQQGLRACCGHPACGELAMSE